MSNAITRRDFTRFAGGLAALAAGSRIEAAKRMPIALELYSIREECKSDLAGSLAKVAAMGYEGVEFAGYHGHSASAVRKMLDENDLKCCSVHTGWPTVQADQLQATIDFNKTIGNHRLIVPGMPAPVQQAIDKYADVAKQFAEIAAKAKEQGMQVGYHNHTWEFEPPAGKRFWDVVAANTPKDFLLQLDIGHCRRAGSDPVAYIRQNAGRSVLLHMKDYSPKSDDILLGDGIVEWKPLFAAAESVGGTEWYIIEQEHYPYPPMECVKRCLDNLKKLL